MFERKSACLLVEPFSQQRQVPEEADPLSLESQAESVKVRVDQAEPALETLIVEGEIKAELAAVQPAQSRKEYYFGQIKLLYAAGLTQRGIARELKVSRNTVTKYLKAPKVPRYTTRPARPSKLDPYKPYLSARWQQGVYKTRHKTI